MGRTIARFRKARKLTQREVATGAGLTFNYVSLIETGESGLSMDGLGRLANVFEVPIEWIVLVAGSGPSDKHLRQLHEEYIEGILASIEIELPKEIGNSLKEQSMFRSGSGKTTQVGYINRNNQKCCGHRGLEGNDHNQFAYQMQCLESSKCPRYGCNGSDVFQRKCPTCQGGEPGIPF